jgi:hypothetical protein
METEGAVQGTHTYEQSGDFTISTTVTSRTGGQTVFADQAHIQNAPLVPVAQTNAPPLQALEGWAMAQTQVAAFVDTNPFSVPSNHFAVINWRHSCSASPWLSG